MKKAIIMTALALIVGITGAKAYNFQLDIEAGAFVTFDGVTGVNNATVFIGTTSGSDTFDWTQPLTAIDDVFTPIGTGSFTIAGDIISNTIPNGGFWPNATITWSSQEPANWNTVFAGESIIAVITDIATQQGDGDPFDGLVTAPDWSSVSEYLIVDTGTNFFDATTSSFITTAPDLNPGEELAGSANAAIIPEPTAALLVLTGLGFQVLRRRRA